MMKKTAILLLTTVLFGCTQRTTQTSLPHDQLSRYSFRKLTIPNGKIINYNIQGNPDGRAILLVHGGGDSQGTWNSWANKLITKYKVISFDLPGHGLSDPLPDQDYSSEKFAEAIEWVVDELKLNDFVIVGHSFGGDATVRYVLKNPKKAKAMILVGSGGFITKEELKRKKELSGYTDKELYNYFKTPKGTKEQFRQSLKGYYYDISKIPEKSLERLYQLGFYEKNAGVVSTLIVNCLKYHEDLKNLDSIQIPTLLLWGEKDEIVPLESARRFKHAINNAKLIVYNNVGHMVQDESPEKSVKDLLSFLTGNAL